MTPEEKYIKARKYAEKYFGEDMSEEKTSIAIAYLAGRADFAKEIGEIIEKKTSGGTEAYQALREIAELVINREGES